VDTPNDIQAFQQQFPQHEIRVNVQMADKKKPGGESGFNDESR
jgi:hypothetical protein